MAVLNTIPLSEVIQVDAVNSASSNFTGFDREDAWAGGKSNGILQYCQTASSQEVHQCDYNKDGDYSKLTAQTTFGDGVTALADRTLAIMPAAGEDSFYYFLNGVKVVVTGIKTFQLSTVEALTGVYIGFKADGDLEIITDTRTAIVFRTLVSFVYDNGGDNIWFACERHGKLLTAQQHLYEHQTRGLAFARAGGGAEVYGLANNATTFTKISASKFADEDIRMVIDEATTIPHLFMASDGDWEVTTASNDLFYTDATDPMWNDVSGGGGLDYVTGNDCIIQAIVASHNKVHPLVNLIGQEKFANRGAARDALYAYVTSLETGVLPGPELRVICTYIISSADNALEVGADDEIWIDGREGGVIPRHDTLV